MSTVWHPGAKGTPLGNPKGLRVPGGAASTLKPSPPKKGKKKSAPAIEVERPDIIPGSGAGGLLCRLQRISGVTGAERLPKAFYFQAPPLDELSWSLTADHNEWDGLDHKRYSRFSSSSLKSLSFTTLLLDNQQWYHHTEPPDIHEQIEELEGLLEGGDAFQLRIYNRQLWTADEVNMSATLRGLQVSERGGEIDGRYITVEFSRWRETEMAKQRRAASKKKETTAVTITKGMTLWKLAVKHYGSGSQWAGIRDANAMSGVRAHDDLTAWAKKRGRKNLTIPVSLRPGNAPSPPTKKPAIVRSPS